MARSYCGRMKLTTNLSRSSFDDVTNSMMALSAATPPLHMLLRHGHNDLAAYRVGRLRKQVGKPSFYEVLGRAV